MKDKRLGFGSGLHAVGGHAEATERDVLGRELRPVRLALAAHLALLATADSPYHKQSA